MIQPGIKILEQKKSEKGKIRKIEFDPDNPKRWYVLILQLAKRDDTIERLLKFGCNIYEPLLHKDIIHHRTKKRIQKSYPLFRRYVFATVPAWDFYGVTAIKGVSGYLTMTSSISESGYTPAFLRNGEVERLMMAEYEDAFNASLLLKNNNSRAAQNHRLRELFPKGSTVKIQDGPFTNFAAQVETAYGKDRLKAIVEIFGRATPVDLEVSQVEKVE